MHSIENHLSTDELALCKAAVGVCPSLNLRKSSRAVSRYFDEALQPVGLRCGQLAMLLVIAQSDQPTYGRLARDMVMDASTIARSLRPLEREGLITRVPGPDRRRKSIALTAEGADRIRTAVPLWQSAQERFLGSIGEDRWHQMLEGLSATLEGTRDL